MNELLSNEEIEALMELASFEGSEFSGSSMDGFESGQFQHEAVVRRMDLFKPNRLSSDQIQKLERMFNGSAKAIGETMSDQLRYAMMCDCVAVEQVRFVHWQNLVGNASAIYVLNAPPLKQPIFFSVTSALLYGWVDRVLGGPGKVIETSHDFSDAEFAVADAFLEPIFKQLVASMSELAEMQIEIEDRFTDPVRAKVLPAQDVVLSVHFQAGSDLLLGDLRVAIAYSALVPFLRLLGTGPGMFKRAPGTLRRTMGRAVRPVGVDLSVNLGEAKMSLRRLLGLKIGDVVCLNQRADRPVIAPVAGIPKFTGQLGRIRGRLGFKIATVLE